MALLVMLMQDHYGFQFQQMITGVLTWCLGFICI